MRGRSKAELVLSQSEREHLQAWPCARIVPGCADGMHNKAVAGCQRVPRQTVSKWGRRFALQRLGGLLDAPRPGATAALSSCGFCAPSKLTRRQNSTFIWPWTTMARTRHPPFGPGSRGIPGSMFTSRRLPRAGSSRSTLVRHVDREIHSSRYASLDTPAQASDPQVSADQQRFAQAICLGQFRRRYPDQHREILSANF